MHDKQQLLQEAVEQEAGPSLTIAEVLAIIALALAVGIWGILATTTAWLWREHGLTWAVAALAGFVIASGLALIVGAARAIEGRRAWREARAYVPPGISPPIPEVHPPIVVHPYRGEPYTIGQPERPLLPGRQEALEITPPVVAEILRASVEQYGGAWSRRKLEALVIEGQKVSRGMYREITSWLTKAGVLQQTRQGGFRLPPDVTEFDDLRRYFPNLPGLAGLDGQPGGPGIGVAQDDRAIGGEGATLADRRRARYLAERLRAERLAREEKRRDDL